MWPVVASARFVALGQKGRCPARYHPPLVARRLLNLVTLLSLLLLTTTVGLLAASPFHHFEVVCRQSRSSAVLVGVDDGGVYVVTFAAPVGGWRAAVPEILEDWVFDLGGFKMGPEVPTWPGSPQFVIFPFWLLLLVFGACTAICLLLLLRRDVRRPLVPGGGFDLPGPA